MGNCFSSIYFKYSIYFSHIMDYKRMVSPKITNKTSESSTVTTSTSKESGPKRPRIVLVNKSQYATKDPMPFLEYTAEKLCNKLSINLKSVRFGTINSVPVIQKNRYYNRNEHITDNLSHPSIIKPYYITLDYVYYKFYENAHDMLNHILDGNEISKENILDIVDTIKYLHNNNIYHFDIKLENILWFSDKRINLIDFGPSGSSYMKSITCDQKQSTPGYNSPEILCNQKFDPFKSDIFSLASTLFCCIHKQFIVSLTNNRDKDFRWMYVDYDSNNNMRDFDSILTSYTESYSGNVDRKVIRELNDLIKLMLKQNPCDRIDINEVSKKLNIIMSNTTVKYF